MQHLADQVLAQARQGLSRATDLAAEVARRLLMAGMNPGGVDRSVTWTDPEEQEGPVAAPVRLGPFASELPPGSVW